VCVLIITVSDFILLKLNLMIELKMLIQVPQVGKFVVLHLVLQHV
jgi:hypothetical protein